MADNVQWEYIVRSVGSLIRAPKDDDMQTLLNAWGEEGWELVAAVPQTNSYVIRLMGKRPMSTTARRRRSMPGMEE